MTTAKRFYLVAALVAALATAAALVTLSTQLTSASSPTATGDAGRLDDGKDLLPQTRITVDQAIALAQTATIDPANSDGETADDSSGDNTAADQNATDGETADGNSGDNTAADPNATDGETADDNGPSIGEIDLEQYNGVLVFNVDVDGVDVKVDATTGAFLGQSSN